MIRIYNQDKEDVGVWINDYLIVLKPSESKMVFVPAGKFSYKVGGEKNETKWDAVSPSGIYILPMDLTGEHKWKPILDKPPPESIKDKQIPNAGMIKLSNDQDKDIEVWINDHLVTVRGKETKYVFVPPGKFSYKIGKETVWDEIENGSMFILPISLPLPPKIEVKPEPEPEPATKVGSAILVVILPIDDAVLSIDGAISKKVGKRREFVTPELKAGVEYYYIVEVVINGEKYRSKAVMKRDETTIVDFTK